MVEAGAAPVGGPINSLLLIEITGRVQAEGTTFFRIKLTKRHDKTFQFVDRRYNAFNDMYIALKE